ncbi:hypothetical protein HanIR_Chr02g0052861 [Helianthus annuus]|nr:hypothetical protein HanIR_Chr02g0052861 [Helianthus annuus]
MIFIKTKRVNCHFGPCHPKLSLIMSILSPSNAIITGLYHRGDVGDYHMTRISLITSTIS